jgi:hypothetical protein
MLLGRFAPRPGFICAKTLLVETKAPQAPTPKPFDLDQNFEPDARNRRLTAVGAALKMSASSMSDDFDGLDAMEKAGIGATLNRCRALASKIGNELRNKRPEHFVDKLSLADVHASLERAADVLSTVKGSQARGRQAAGARLGRRARRPSRRGRRSA